MSSNLRPIRTSSLGALLNTSVPSSPRPPAASGGKPGFSSYLVVVLTGWLAWSLLQGARLTRELKQVKSSGGRCAWDPSSQLTGGDGVSGGAAGATGEPDTGGGSSGSSGDDDAGSAAETMARVLAGAVLLAWLAVVWFVTYRLDHLPLFARRFIESTVLGGTSYPEVPLSKPLAYYADIWFSTNPWSKTHLLLLLTIALIVTGAGALFTVSNEPLFETFWQAMAGAGIDWTFAEGAVSNSSWMAGLPARVVSVAISVTGMLVTALMLSLVSDSISDSLENLKRGKADVLETDHTVILGWSDKLPAIVAQLCLANESAGGRPIVILAERDKEGMEEEIAQHEIDMRGSRVVCRCGNPLILVDLNKVSVRTARSIIVLSTCEEPDQSDTRVLRIVLALMAMHDWHKRRGLQGLKGHIVAELADLDNEHLVSVVGMDRVQTVVSHDIIGRLMLQCARQRGLASVWEKLIGFEGDEFYVKEWPELVGRTFGEAMLRFPSAVPIGISVPSNTGEPRHDVLLNPPDSHVIGPGEQLIVLAEDDDTYAPTAKPAVVSCGQGPEVEDRQAPEKILFCGWRRDMDDLIVVLDQFVAPGSELWLYNEVPIAERTDLLLQGGMDPEKDLVNLKLVFMNPELQGDLFNRRRLRALHPEQFSSIMVLADKSAGDSTDADSRSLATLLTLRDIQSERRYGLSTISRTKSMRRRAHSETATSRAASTSGTPMSVDSRGIRMSMAGLQEDGASSGQQPGSPATLLTRPSVRRGTDVDIKEKQLWHSNVKNVVSENMIISEILDSRTRNLIMELRISEFVLSNELVSMALAMISENPDVKTILSELFTEEGQDLYVKPASRYLRSGEVLSFFEVMARGRQRQEIVLGYVQKPTKAAQGGDGTHYPPVINPKDKLSKTLSLATIQSVIFMAEDA